MADCGFDYMGAAVLLLCLLTARHCLNKYCLLKNCTESRMKVISSGRDKLAFLLLTQAVGESFVIGVETFLCPSLLRRSSPSSLHLLIWLVSISACCDINTSTHAFLCPHQETAADYVTCQIRSTFILMTFTHFLKSPQILRNVKKS